MADSQKKADRQIEADSKKDADSQKAADIQNETDSQKRGRKTTIGRDKKRKKKENGRQNVAVKSYSQKEADSQEKGR